MEQNTLPARLRRYASCFDSPIPEDIPERVFAWKAYSPLRDYALQHMGFSVVTRRAARAILEITGPGTILEVMCGSGAWTEALRLEGGRVLAADNLSWMDPAVSSYAAWRQHARIPDIIPMDAAAAIRRYGPETDFIFMSWPPLDDDAAVTVLRVMRAVNPACRLLYLGEAHGGCTGSSAFFREWEDISETCPAVKKARQVYRRWESHGCSDTVYLVK